ncbi:hypothetical protein BH20ACT19_BH20ACT19_11410 [soil metagenome]
MRLADDGDVAEDEQSPTGWRLIDPLLARWIRAGRTWPQP